MMAPVWLPAPVVASVAGAAMNPRIPGASWETVLELEMREMRETFGVFMGTCDTPSGIPRNDL